MLENASGLAWNTPTNVYLCRRVSSLVVFIN